MTGAAIGSAPTPFRESLALNRPLVRISLAAASLLICCGDTSGSCKTSNNNSFNIGPSKGQVIGAAVGVGAVIAVGTVVLVHVHNVHHTVKGCVLATADGIEVQTGDHKMYHLAGDVSKIHEGDLVDLHGDKIKKTKDAKGDQVFQVTKLKKDHGPCKVAPSTP